MSKLMMFWFQPFLTPPFNFGHEKNSFEYVMNFEKHWTNIMHNKQL
jgi:hypothetical protein